MNPGYHHPGMLLLSLFSLFEAGEVAALFHHRMYHESERPSVSRTSKAWLTQPGIIVGDYLYIDGGEEITWNGTGSGIQDGYGFQLQGCTYNSTCAGTITNAPGLCCLRRTNTEF